MHVKFPHPCSIFLFFDMDFQFNSFVLKDILHDLSSFTFTGTCLNEAVEGCLGDSVVEHGTVGFHSGPDPMGSCGIVSQVSLQAQWGVCLKRLSLCSSPTCVCSLSLSLSLKGVDTSQKKKERERERREGSEEMNNDEV